MRLAFCPRIGLAAVFVILAGLAGGCDLGEIVADGKTRVPPKEYIGVYRLAQSLNMTVVSNSSVRATMKDTVNIVNIYPDPEGQVFVNLKPVGHSGGIICDEGEILVPSTLEAEIRQAIRPANTRTVQPPPTKIVNKVKPPVKKIVKVEAAQPAVNGSVVVDPGHGGHDPGARSVLGNWEKGINLDVGTRLAENLRTRGVSTTMTRSDDRFIELEDRSGKANAINASLFVSVHADKAPRLSARGFTIYIGTNASQRSVSAATAIHRRLSAAGFPSMGIRRKNLVVLRTSKVPAVLVELGYLSNRAEATGLNDPATRTVYAKAIEQGICDYLKASK